MKSTEIKQQRMIKQTAFVASLITNQFDFISVTYLWINRGLYFISNVLFDLTILVISVWCSHVLDSLMLVLFLAVITVFMMHNYYDKKSQDTL